MILIAIAMMMEIIDTTIVNVAIPALQHSLHATSVDIQWTVGGYATAFAVLLITGGRLGDIWGYRRAFMLGLGGFALSSLLCGVVQTAGQLAAMRVLQGASAALLLPQVTSLVQVMYAPHERLAPLSVFGVIGGASAALGPIIGGVLIDANLFGLSWRPIFLINVPVGVVALLITPHLLRDRRSNHAAKLDPLGTALVTLAMIGLVVPLIEGRGRGWPYWCFASIAGAVSMVPLIVRHSRRLEARGGSPLLLLSLLSLPAYRIGLGTAFLFEASLSGFLLILTMALQSGLGFDPAVAGMIHMPFAIGTAGSITLIARRLLRRTGPMMMPCGAGFMAVGLMVLLGMVAPDWGGRQPLLLLVPLFVMGLGMGMLVGPLGACSLSDVERSQAGAASGLLKSTQQLGGAVGVSVVGTLFFTLRGTAESGAPVLHAFRVAGLLVAGQLLLAGFVAAFTPRTLRLFAGAPIQKTPTTIQP